MRKRQLLLLLGCLLLSGCSGVNTRVGWPTHYWQHGLDKICVFALVSFAAVAGIIVLFNALDSNRNPSREQFWGAVALFVAATVLLQWTPTATSGINLVPPFPWLFWGRWVPFGLSVLAWLAGCLALFVVVYGTPNDDDASLGAFFGIVMLTFTIILSFWGSTPSESQQSAPKVNNWAESDSVVPRPEASGKPSILDDSKCREHLTKWQAMRESRSEVLSEFHSDREDLVGQLRGMGVNGSGDLKDDRRAQLLADELLELSRQIDVLHADIERLDVAILQTESVLRRIQRRRSLSESGVLSNGEQELMSRLSRELAELMRPGDKLPTPVSDVETDQLIDRLLHSDDV
jgi:hypothetical protein